MNARLITIAAAALCALGGTIAVATAAVPVSAAVTPHPTLHVINLHSRFTWALRTTEAGPHIIFPPRGKRPAARPARLAGCTEPNCDLSYNGGPVQHTPHVYLLLWGPNWTNTDPGFGDLDNLYSGLGVTSEDSWSTITSQYGDTSGPGPTFGTTVFQSPAYQDSSTPPNPVTPNALAAEAGSFAQFLGITDLTDAQIVVASQSGTCFGDGFAGSCGTPGPGQYCAWHSYAVGGGLAGDLPFTNLPYQLDAGTACGENFVNSGSAGTYDGFSIVGGHEFAESVTDPEPPSGWFDPADNISGGEIGDKCAWGGFPFGTAPFGDVTLTTGSFAMQSSWSNAAGRCVITTAPVLNVTTPASQASTLGSKVGLQVLASSNTDSPLTYTATGLPHGLSINSITGMISGTPGVTAGSYVAHVTVSDYADSQTVSFGWKVSSKPGAIKGYASKCVDDFRNRRVNGNKIDIWSCDGLARQRITFTARGELQVAGKCITASSSRAVLDRCTGASAQTWTRRSNGEYVIKTGHCLTDPRNSRTNGTQLRLQACVRAADQRWSLP